ncbi:MAG: hypothetical protein ABI612_22290 [Betaproteobacteria bacterium]
MKLAGLAFLRPGLRAQTMLLGLILLAVPWAGYRYVVGMERFLRQGQERALAVTARAVAIALNNRPRLFQESGMAPLGATDESLYVRALPGLVVLDGMDLDWPSLTEASAEAPITYLGAAVSMSARLGKRDRFLYVLMNVTDERLVYRASERARVDSGDRVEIGLVNPRGVFQRYVIAPDGPGSIHAMRVTGEDASLDAPVAESRIEGFWRQVPQGYVVELRMPLTMVGLKFGCAAISVDDLEARETTPSAGNAEDAALLAPIMIPESEIDLVLQGMGRTTFRVWVVDRHHRVLAQTGTLKTQPDAIPPQTESVALPVQWWHRLEAATLRRVYERVLRAPTEDFDEGPQDTSAFLSAAIDEALQGSGVTRWRMTPDQRAVVLSAVHPILVGELPVGAVIVEETTNGILSVRSRALETLFTTALIVLMLGTLILFLFANRLSTRVRRLRDEAEQAVDPYARALQHRWLKRG